MKYFQHVLFVLIFSFSNLFSQVTCNQFEIKYSLEDDNLNLYLMTDLPDNTDIMVSISRSYWETGNSAEYSVDYFSEKSTISKWRKEKEIDINDIIWEKALKKKQNEMSKIGLGFTVSKKSDEIEVRFVVPVRQTNPVFGKNNSKLTGTKVRQEGLKIVEDESKIVKPLGKTIAAKSTASLDPRSLTIGKIYRLSKKTSLMPELNPANPEISLSKVRNLVSGDRIKIIKISEKNGIPWYRVVSYNGKGIKIAEGWINSTVLLGQDLTVID